MIDYSKLPVKFQGSTYTDTLGRTKHSGNAGEYDLRMEEALQLVAPELMQKMRGTVSGKKFNL